MFNSTTIAVVIVVNIFALVFATFNLFKRKHIVNFLIACSIWSLAIIEVAKFSYLFDFSLAERALGVGLCLTILFWLIASVSLLPAKSYSLSRGILSPLFGVLALVFFLIWWIKPFIVIGQEAGGVVLSKLARYFFVLVTFSLVLVLSNLERGVYYLRQKGVRLLLASALLLLAPYVLLSAYAVLIGEINIFILTYSSFAVCGGSLLFLFAAKDGFSTQAVKEEAVVHTSLVLFLLGGYLFFIGAFIKLFQAFGWNLNTLFSFLTTVFILFAFFFLLFSTSFKERIKNIFFKHLTRQKYDWQKIWEDFTYKISLVTDIEKIKASIQESISKIMNVTQVSVFVFERELPFEKGFSDWFLRQASAFNVGEVFSNGFDEKFPLAKRFFKEHKITTASPLCGERKIIGLIGLGGGAHKFLDKELLKVLSLQASGVILSCWANQALRDAEKKESMYKVSSFVIHDVKNYINNLSLLIANKDKFNRPDFQEDALVTLESTIEKMKQLMDEFKALRGDIAMHKRDHRLCDIVEEALRDISKERLTNVSLSVDVDCSVEVFADAQCLYKVVLNLVINALEAMDNSGELSISMVCDKQFAYLSVKDSGCGMSKEFIENRLFKPFNSTKKKGLGIGLYQCKTIVEAHEGTILAESRIGGPTTFRVKLPLARKRIEQDKGETKKA